MTKQLSLSATVSALAMTMFALSVAVGNFQEERAQNSAGEPFFATAATSAITN